MSRETMRVRFLRAQACYYGLDGADNLGQYSDEDLASIYNGIGPSGSLRSSGGSWTSCTPT